ncbi:urease accessory protein UreD [Pseudogemmobacter sonorensis]|uniref:urease accessory protein UreD n=1 Tax=Pseudogemmobacter sonorensis TaxID=2989681 RepID=UPI0036CD44A7
MTAHFQPGQMQRSRGEAAVRLVARPGSGEAVIAGLRQQGSAKAILPHAGAEPEVVFLNTSGGLTGGDRLAYRLDLGSGCRATAMTQTAERAYRAGQGTAEVEVAMTVGAGGWLDWLPQETILFDRSALSRRTVITLGPGAGCLAIEAVVLGRAAMRETLAGIAFRDRREIWRGPTPVMVEPLAISTEALSAGRAVLGGARAFASLTMVSTGAEAALPALRAALDEPGVEAAASGLDGRLMCRMRAGDGWPLRRQITRALAVLRQRPLPRVWQTLERMA